LLNRLALAFGRAPPDLEEAGKAFPRAYDLACTNLASLQVLGFSRSKAVAIIEIASAVENGGIRPEELAELDDDIVLAKLDELRGVGRWTAEYVLLRGYGRLNIFPGDDIGARNSLQRWLGLRAPLDYERTRKVLRRWRPYGGLVYLHLLLKYLDEKGLIRGGCGATTDSIGAC
jgi:DNA-3-methyladenine glycosylase II